MLLNMIQFKDNRLVKFGAHVKAIREKQGLSIHDIASNSSLPKSTIIAIENGEKNFGFTTFLELARAIKVSPEELLRVNLEN